MEKSSRPLASKAKLMFSAVFLIGITTGFLWSGIKGLVTGSLGPADPITRATDAGQYWLIEFLHLGGGVFFGVATVYAFWKRWSAKPESRLVESEKVNWRLVILVLMLLGLVLSAMYVAAHRP
jgi:hypothetical protein